MKQKLLLKSLLLLCALVAGSSSVWAESTDSYTASSSDKPTAKNGTTTGSVTGTNSISWSYSVTQETKKSKNPFVQYSDDYGWQLGSSNSPCKAFSISTSGISGTITQIQVVTGSANASSTINVTVGGDGFGTQNQATGSGSTVSTQTFTGSASGEIIVSATASSAAFYFKSVTVTYTPSGGGGDSDPSITLGTNTVNAPETAISTTSIEVTYNNLTNYDADVIFYEADGTTNATYDHTWLTAEINATTKNLDYSITANTGAARTAYLRVYALGDEGEAESSLITITQAAKPVATPTFSPDGGTFWQGTEITLTSGGNTIYYNMTTDGTDPATPTSNSTQYSAPIVLGNNTAKIWAIAYDTYGNKSSVVKRTYTGVAPATLPFSWDAKETSTKGVISTSVGTYDASPYLKFDATNDNLILKFDGVPGTLTFDIKGNSFSDGTFKVQTSADGETYSDLKVYTSLGDKTTEKFILANTVRYIKWIYTTKSSGNVALGNIKLALPEPAQPTTSGDEVYLTTSDNMAGWRTFFDATQAYTVDANTTVYAAQANESKIKLVSFTDGIPAGTPVILHTSSSADSHKMTLTKVASVEATVPSDNILAATSATTTNLSAGVYRLGYKASDGIGFYSYASATAPAGIIYIAKDALGSDAPSFIGFEIGDDNTTGVNEVRSQMDNVRGDFYDMQGRKVAQPTKGLYIVNGKKYIVK